MSSSDYRLVEMLGKMPTVIQNQELAMSQLHNKLRQSHENAKLAHQATDGLLKQPPNSVT